MGEGYYLDAVTVGGLADLASEVQKRSNEAAFNPVGCQALNPSVTGVQTRDAKLQQGEGEVITAQ